MGIADEASRLRVEVIRLGTATGRRYSSRNLRQRILRWVERAKRSGMSERDCSERLGIPQRQFHRWRVAEGAPEQALVPVEVASDESRNEGSIAFVSPNGYRIEGLTIGQAIVLLRALT